jgi:hypothetical protein
LMHEVLYLIISRFAASVVRAADVTASLTG